MIAIVEVGLATSRPPREHRTVRCVVSVDVVDLNIGCAEREAELVAIGMAMCGADSVMPVRSTILEIMEI